MGCVGSSCNEALADGICGAPIVGLPCTYQGLSGGGVAGFFQLHGRRGWTLFCACVDYRTQPKFEPQPKIMKIKK